MRVLSHRRSVTAGKLQKGLENSAETGNQREKTSGDKQNSPKNAESHKGGEMGGATAYGLDLREGFWDVKENGESLGAGGLRTPLQRTPG